MKKKTIIYSINFLEKTKEIIELMGYNLMSGIAFIMAMFALVSIYKEKTPYLIKTIFPVAFGLFIGTSLCLNLCLMILKTILNNKKNFEKSKDKPNKFFRI